MKSFIVYSNNIIVLTICTIFLLLLQFFSLLVPLLALRYQMGEVKQNVKKYLDHHAIESGHLKFEIINSEDKDERARKVEQLTNTVTAYQDYENVPLWPISFATIGKYVAQMWTVLVFIGIMNHNAKPMDILVCKLDGQEVQQCFNKKTEQRSNKQAN